jgi:hypothetical protein
MPVAFRTEDGSYYQTFLSRKRKKIVGLVIEKLLGRADDVAGWDWMVWTFAGQWREPDVRWHGTAPSLRAAKSAALNAAFQLSLRRIGVRRGLANDAAGHAAANVSPEYMVTDDRFDFAAIAALDAQVRAPVWSRTA